MRPVCLRSLVYNLLVRPSVTRKYHPKVLEFFHRLQCSSYSVPWLGFLERRNTSVFLVLVFIPTWSHAAENLSSACCWRPFFRRCKQHQIIRKRQTVNLAACKSDTLFDVVVTVDAIHIHCFYIHYEYYTMNKSGNSTHLCRSPARMVKCCCDSNSADDVLLR